MGLLADIRNREPRLKPGITWFRLFVFLVAVVVLAVLGEHFATGHYPTVPSDCEAKEIDTSARKEGTCTNGGTRLVVVDRHSTLTLDSLEARLEGIGERRTISGPAGSRTAEGDFLTFDLAVTNRTDSLARFTAGQAVLLLGEEAYGEEVGVERGLVPHSFLARRRYLAPGRTESGTVTFAVPAQDAANLAKEGNLDLENFGADSGAFEPEAIFEEPEYGVIRTYK